MRPKLGTKVNHTTGYGLAAVPFALLMIVCANGAAHSEEIKLLSPNAMKPALAELVPQFEQSSGHKVIIKYGSASSLTKRIQAGEVADLAILSPKQHELLRKEGKVSGDSVLVAKVGFGIIVRKGAVKPDITSVDALKRTLLDAKSIASADPAKGSSSGRFLATLLERLGIAAETKTKMKLFPTARAAVEAIGRGEVDIGLGTTSSENRPGTELVGALPGEVQSLNLYAIGILARTNHSKVAKSLISALTSSSAHRVLKEKGFDLP